MPTVTSSFLELLSRFEGTFIGPVYRNFVVLSLGAVLNKGRQTVCNIVRVYPWRLSKHWSCLHHFLSTVKWSPLDLSRTLCSLILSRIPKDQDVILIADDTLIRRWGNKVSRISVHRDPVRSGNGHTAYARGHQWLTICILFKTPVRKRPWALPVIIFPQIPKKVFEKEKAATGRTQGNYRSPTDLIILGLRLLRRWFPSRYFMLLVDSSLNTHQLHRFMADDDQLDVIGACRMDTVLHEEPPDRIPGTRGRPRKVGKRLPSPGQAAQFDEAHWLKQLGRWYGNIDKELYLLSGEGIWYRPGETTPKVRWVVIRDPKGKNSDFALSSSKITMKPVEIESLYVDRWHIETTFEEARKHLNIETTENWSKKSVERTIPLLFGLFSLIILWFCDQSKSYKPKKYDWYPKNDPTFSDAITCLRTHLWSKVIFCETQSRQRLSKNHKRILKLIISKAALAA